MHYFYLNRNTANYSGGIDINFYKAENVDLVIEFKENIDVEYKKNVVFEFYDEKVKLLIKIKPKIILNTFVDLQIIDFEKVKDRIYVKYIDEEEKYTKEFIYANENISIFFRVEDEKLLINYFYKLKNQ